MSSITLHPTDGSPSYVVWSDGEPFLTPNELADAEPLIGLRLGLTPEGPTFTAGWGEIGPAAVLIRDLFPRDGWTLDPPIDVSLPDGVF